MAAVDVIVVGLGGMGSAAAHHLAARGQRVLGLERFGPAHDRGSSHGGSRIVRQSYFEDPAYVPLLLRAYELWDALGAETGEPVLHRTGGVYVGREDSHTFSGSLLAATQWSLPHEVLTADDLRRRFPTFSPRADEVALYEAAAGYARPEATVAAQLDRAAALGADLRFHEPVTGWSSTPGGGVTVTTGTERHTAGHLVVCPGAWAPDLLADLGLELEVRRMVMHWFAPSGGVEAYLPDRHPIYVHGDGDEQVYGFPAVDGPDGGAKVAFFRRGSECTPSDIDRTVAPAEVTAMAEQVSQILPGLPGRHLRAATCMYTNTVDQHFVVAPHPAHEHVTVACGFSGHGFKFVPVIGEVLADLATTGTTAHPVSLFDPARFAGAGPVAQAPLPEDVRT